MNFILKIDILKYKFNLNIYVLIVALDVKRIMSSTWIYMNKLIHVGGTL